MRDQARRDRQVKLDAEAEARTLNDELAARGALIDQLRDDAVEAAPRAAATPSPSRLQGRVAALEAAARDADDRVASTAGALERAGLQRRDATTRAEADAARRAPRPRRRRRARPSTAGGAHADLRTAHDALGEEVRRNAAEIVACGASGRRRRATSRLRASADPRAAAAAARPLAPGARAGSPSKHLAAGPTPWPRSRPPRHAAGYRPPQSARARGAASWPARRRPSRRATARPSRRRAMRPTRAARSS